VGGWLTLYSAGVEARADAAHAGPVLNLARGVRRKMLGRALPRHGQRWLTRRPVSGNPSGRRYQVEIVGIFGAGARSAQRRRSQPAFIMIMIMKLVSVLLRLKDANGLLHRAGLGCLRSQASRDPGNSSPEIPGETAKKEAEGRQILAAMPGRVVTDPR
jgi:hypothetical protein